MYKWEYMNVYVSDEERDQYVGLLNLAGEDGWEFTGHIADAGHGLSYLMKRGTRID